MNRWFVCFVVSFLASQLVSQSDTIPEYSVEEITIKALKLKLDFLESNSAVFQINNLYTQHANQHLNLQELIRNAPGLYLQNANNFAQDLRISSRGFGARSSFGIRGIKLIVDGIPESTPDGQGQVDNLNLALIDRIEILRGPNSGIYGNATGGLIQINSLKSFDKSFAQINFGGGSDGFQSYHLVSGVKSKNTDFSFFANHVINDGYREHSRMRQSQFQLRGYHKPSDKFSLDFIINASHSPLAEDGGGLNESELLEDRTQARDRNVLFNSGEEVDQIRASISANYHLSASDKLFGYIFFTKRQFDGRLPFEMGGQIDLSRNFIGIGTRYERFVSTEDFLFNSMVGYDLQFQNDRRKRFENLEGERGLLQFDQNEEFDNIGIYLMQQIKWKNLNFTANLRQDWNKIAANDFYVSDGDGSGSRNLFNFSYGFSLAYLKEDRFNVYLSYSTGFETPSLNEISTNPVSSVGFNQNLDPQFSKSYEFGVNLIDNQKLNTQISLFHIDSENELVPFEIPEFPDRTFYRNAGETSRTGIELFQSFRPFKFLEFGITYNFSNFFYRSDNISIDNNRLPGIPQHNGNVRLLYQNPNGFLVNLNVSYSGALFAEDANEIKIDAFTLANLKISQELKIGKIIFHPYFGINNVFGTLYNDNIRINAFGGRHYEAAPERQFYMGVKIGLN